MGLEIWQVLGIIFTVCTTLVAPAIWYAKTQASRTQESTERLIESLHKSTKDMVDSVVATQERNAKETREDLKEFREHFDKRISEIYNSIDTKNKELREFITTEINYIKALINELDKKIEITREKNHELEKELMRIQNDNQKTFVTKEHFEAIIKLQGKLETND